MNTPLVSVCLSTGSSDKLLARAIDSVIAQSFSNWELVLYVPNPSLESEEIARSYVEKDARIRLAANSAQSAITAGQKSYGHSVQSCRGLYIKLLVGNFVLAPDCLKIMLSAIEKQENLRLVSSAMASAADDDNLALAATSATAAANAETSLLLNGKDVIRQYLESWQSKTGHLSQMFFRREDLTDQIASILTDYHADPLALSLLETGEFCFISEPLVYGFDIGAESINELDDMSFLSARVQILDSFGHYAQTSGSESSLSGSESSLRTGDGCRNYAALWKSAIRDLIQNLSSRWISDTAAFDDFVTPGDWRGRSFPNDEPEKYRRLACQILNYLMNKQTAADALANVRQEKAELKVENERLLGRMQALGEEIYARQTKKGEAGK